jgi:hypothetical protein
MSNCSTYLLLPGDHAVQEGLQAFLKILHALLFKSRHFGFYQLRALIKFVLGVQCSAFNLNNRKNPQVNKGSGHTSDI